jgi:hypothetical protein
VTAKFVKLTTLSMLLAASVGCGEFTRQGRSPMILVVEELTVDEQHTLLSDVITGGSILNDMATVSLKTILKDPGSPTSAAAPSDLNMVTINRYRVEYQRTDGRNTAGVDVPYPFDSAISVTVCSCGTSEAAFELVRHSAKEEAPLKALSFNRNIISTIATVTFYGHDLAGNDISGSGSIGINFGDFADED